MVRLKHIEIHVWLFEGLTLERTRHLCVWESVFFCTTIHRFWMFDLSSLERVPWNTSATHEEIQHLKCMFCCVWTGIMFDFWISRQFPFLKFESFEVLQFYFFSFCGLWIFETFSNRCVCCLFVCLCVCLFVFCLFVCLLGVWNFNILRLFAVLIVRSVDC